MSDPKDDIKNNDNRHSNYQGLVFDSNPSDMSRQELYDAIRQSSMDEVILHEMERLGFWSPSKDKRAKAGLSGEASDEAPTVEVLIKQQGRLQRELTELARKKRLLDNPDQALRLMHNKRKADARQKRKDTKRNQTRTRYEKAHAWWQKNQADILYLGEGTAASLQNLTVRVGFSLSMSSGVLSHDADRLSQQQLPQFENVQALASALGVPLNELKFLAFSRKTSTTSHYQRFSIPKKTGGMREISAPMPRLKRLQYWLLDNILQSLPVHSAAHGFVPQRSIVTNAQPHVGQDVVINCDLKDFFSSITFPRVKGWFNSLGYSEQFATIFALLCTEQPADAMTLDGELWHVGRGQRRLPQGAPTSPAITNQLCYRMDCRLQGLAQKLGFNYTRYADDLTFSASGESAEHVHKLLSGVRFITKREGFRLHPNKTRIMRKGRKQEVTGIVVNDKLSVDRATLRKFRAVLHRIRRSGIETVDWQGHSTDTGLLRSLKGYANFVAMVDPVRGMPLREEVQRIWRYYHVEPQAISAAKANFRTLSVAGNAPLPKWWTPTGKAKPELPASLKQSTSTADGNDTHVFLADGATVNDQHGTTRRNDRRTFRRSSRRNYRRGSSVEQLVERERTSRWLMWTKKWFFWPIMVAVIVAASVMFEVLKNIVS